MFMNAKTQNASSSFHFVLTVYFEDDAGLPSADFLRELCVNVAEIGKESGCVGTEGSFWSVEAAPSPARRMKIRPGSRTPLELFDSLPGNTPICGSVCWVHKESDRRYDSDIELICMPAVPRRRTFIPATLQLSFSECIAKQLGAEPVIEVMQKCLQSVDALRPFYAFIDVALLADANGGANYGPLPNLSTSIQQKLQMNEWIFHGAKSRARVRGIYWGNYFGSRILDVLGGRESFIQDYERQIGGNVHPTAVVRKMKNGVFVSLSKSILSAVPSPAIEHYELSLDRNLLWLQAELAKHCVLGSWDKDIANDAQRTVSGEA
jgi:hypothetical protein